MTRETKIGLLMGLGFIVVFAVLLSHTSEDRLAGTETDDFAPTVPHRSPQSDVYANRIPAADRPADTDLPGADRREGTRPDVDPVVEDRHPSPVTGEWGAPELPSPEAFNPSVAWGPRAPSPWDEMDHRGAGGSPGAETEDARTMEGSRDASDTELTYLARGGQRAPEAVFPESTTLAGSRHEGGSSGTAGADRESADQGEVLTVAPRTYVVQKGDSLIKIAKDHYQDAYQKSAMKVVEYLADSNKDRIKSKDFVIEGQELILPALPSNMFEPAPNFGPAQLTLHTRRTESSVPDTTGPRIAVSDGQRAPREVAGSEESGDADYRWYVIKKKDTLSSIAQKELGSMRYWQEIQKLNQINKPTELRPGDRIKIPVRASNSGGDQTSRA